MAQLCQNSTEVEPQLGEFFLRDFNEYFFVLHAKLIDLRHIRHTQKLLAHIVGKAFDFGGGKTGCIERVDHAKHITKLVIEKRPLHALRQGVADISNFLAHGVPNIGYICWLRIVFDLKNDLRFARLGVATNLVGERHFLQGALELVGDLLRDLLRGSTGPVGANNHRAESKRRVFVLAELEIGGNAQHHQHDHQVAREGGMFQRPFGEVKTFHRRLTSALRKQTLFALASTHARQRQRLGLRCSSRY